MVTAWQSLNSSSLQSYALPIDNANDIASHYKALCEFGEQGGVMTSTQALELVMSLPSRM